MRRGLYRILGTGGRPNDVRVDDDGISVPVEEGIYRARGYQPPVGELPWEEDYKRQDVSAKH
ncbi:MAG TPA: hypothetical protein VMF32_25145 [Xanthobacteraceae bacterium]|nr:hypothetical protein [Xanthobacteraceae bacterium]